MKKEQKVAISTALLAAVLAVPVSASADSTTTPKPVVSKSAKAAKTADPAKVAYQAALAQYKLDLAAYKSAVLARQEGRKTADATLKTELAAAKTNAEKQSAKAKHSAAISALPTLPTKPTAPTK